MRGSVVHDLVRRSGNISVHVIAGDEEGMAKPTVQTAARQEPFNPRPYMMALLFVAIGLAAATLIRPMFGGIENVDLVFLTAVVAVAARFGLWPSLFASGEAPKVIMEREGLIGQADGSRPRPVLGRAYEMIAQWDENGVAE